MRQRSAWSASRPGCRFHGSRRSSPVKACSCSVPPGTSGSVAVQAAKILGAGRVVAVGRDADRLKRALELGADAVVEIGDDLGERLAASVADAPPTLVFDALWGAPLEAAAAVTAPGGRIVHLGQSAGPTATLASGLVRGRQLQILGYSNFAVPQDAIARGYTRPARSRGCRPDRRSRRRRYRSSRCTTRWSRQVAGARRRSSCSSAEAVEQVSIAYSRPAPVDGGRWPRSR